jgi:hypothetical protein
VRLREIDGVRGLICSPLEDDGFTNGFSARLGGVSPMPQAALNLAGFNEDAAENILENRRRFLKLFSGEWSLGGCWQMHGTDIRVIRDAAEAKPAENSLGDTIYCDAVVSDAEQVLAGVKTADCVPILIGDPETKSFAAVHAGWRGTYAGIVLYAIERLSNEYKARPENCRVAIGPAAAACCYEVGSEVIDGFKERFPGADELFTPTREGHARIDLFKANRDHAAFGYARVGCVDQVVSVAVGRHARAALAHRVAPNQVVHGVDRAVPVVVAHRSGGGREKYRRVPNPQIADREIALV